jgi:hypothetical protein
METVCFCEIDKTKFEMPFEWNLFSVRAEKLTSLAQLYNCTLSELILHCVYEPALNIWMIVELSFYSNQLIL